MPNVIALVLAAAAPAAAAAKSGAAHKLPTFPGVPGSGAPAPAGASRQLTLPPVQQIVPKTWFQDHAGWLTHGLAAIFILAAIGLVVLLALQTTKQEGLSGTIGGQVQSAYRGRLGAEEQLKRITGVAAVAFVVVGTILSLTGI